MSETEHPEREDAVVQFDREELDRGFTQVPNYLLRDPGLSLGARMTWALLASYAWRSAEAFAGQETLAVALDVKVRSVQRYLGELKDRGLLTVERRGLGKTNIYRLRLVASRGDSSVVSEATLLSHEEDEVQKKTQREEIAAPTANTGEQGSLVPEPADELFVRWQQVFDRWDARFTPARRRTALKALKEEPNVDVLEQAMRGFKLHRTRKPGGIELGDIFGTHPNSGDLRSRIEWARSLYSQGAGAPLRVRDRLDRLPSDRRGIVQQRADDVVAARNSGQINEAAEQTVREQLGLAPNIQDGRMIGWQQA